MKEDRQYVTALARGMAVLRCFSVERNELGTSEIARLTGLPQPTVWRLCYTLSKLGYLVPGHEKERLRIGPGIWAIQSSGTRTRLVDLAFEGMQSLAKTYQVAVSLAEPDGTAMMIVQRAQAHTLLSLNLAVGSSLPIENSALGAAYWCALPTPQRQVLQAALQRQRPAAWLEHHAYLAQCLRQYQRLGYVLNLRHFHPEVNAIGVPVIASGNTRIMVLNCGGAGSSVTPALLRGPIADAMKALAQRISGWMSDGAV
jgi:DNA-binding IclR family transcriptional regulator